VGDFLETDIITIRERAAYLKMAEKTLYIGGAAIGKTAAEERNF